MSDSGELRTPQGTGVSIWQGAGPRVLTLLFLLYGFLVSIGLLSKAFTMFSGGFVDGLIASASNPLLGLFVGILATTLVQSSSTTTSIVVAMVGSGSMPIHAAIPVVMGANIGTSVTNTLVSLGHLSRGQEFERAFAASTVHDFFNIFAVVILFPLQVTTNFLGILAADLAEIFQEMGGLTFASPLKMVTGPAVNGLTHALDGHPWILLILAMMIMFASLRYLVVALKKIVLGRVEAFFDQTLFANAGRAMLFGLLITVLVQSSSITTSLAVPLAGAGVLSLVQIFPYTLGTNVGTTITAMLAALAVGEISAVTVAFAHMLFNICGIVLIWPIPAIRRIPLRLAEGFAAVAANHRWLAIAYIAICFYAVPFAAILILR
jgi:solute carrier family 34 (sodium-dependent phosphate cotransporter)